jgi:hypothetical protein
VTAAEEYVAALDRPDRGRARRLVDAGLDIVGAALGGLLDLSSAGTVVVRRRSDGVEVLRVDGGPAEASAQLLHHVREQLDTLSAEEFRDRWGIAAATP